MKAVDGETNNPLSRPDGSESSPLLGSPRQQQPPPEPNAFFIASSFMLARAITLIFKASPNQPTIWSRGDRGTTFALSRTIVPVAREGSSPSALSSP